MQNRITATRILRLSTIKTKISRLRIIATWILRYRTILIRILRYRTTTAWILKLRIILTRIWRQRRRSSTLTSDRKCTLPRARFIRCLRAKLQLPVSMTSVTDQRISRSRIPAKGINRFPSGKVHSRILVTDLDLKQLMDWLFLQAKRLLKIRLSGLLHKPDMEVRFRFPVRLSRSKFCLFLFRSDCLSR